MISFKIRPYPDHIPQTCQIIMSLLMMTHIILKPSGKTTTVALQKAPRFDWDMIQCNIKTTPQLIWKVRNSFHMEIGIFVFKLTGKLPMNHSVPNKGNWLKLLTRFLRLNHFNKNLSFLKGYCIMDNCDKYLLVVLQLIGNSCYCYNNNCITKLWAPAINLSIYTWFYWHCFNTAL